MTDEWQDGDEVLETLIKSGAGLAAALLMVVAGFQAWGGSSGSNDQGFLKAGLLLVAAVTAIAMGWWSLPRMLVADGTRRQTYARATVVLAMASLACVLLAWLSGSLLS